MSSMILGSGEHRYRTTESWGKLPHGWAFGDVAAVGVDRHDNVYVFHRGEHPMIVFDREGNFLRTWGEGVFLRPHGISMGPEDTIYCTDDGDHSVRKCTLEGKVLLTIGRPGEPAPYMSGEPFNRCTHTALAPNGDIYISDGYGNACVHKYTPDGRPILKWGRSGTDPGEFNLPHNIACDDRGHVYVTDRENHRVQVFDGNGRFETQWLNMHRPSGMFMTTGKSQLFYVGEDGPSLGFNRGAPNLGPRVAILDNQGRPISRLGTTPAAGIGPGQYVSPHAIAVDTRGDIYVGEVAYTAWPALFPGQPPPEGLRCLQKFIKVSAAAG
jgi:DNA-binding beta-propeller fold protein YncE